MKAATFTYYGRTEEQNRTIRFYKNQHGSYTCDIEGMPLRRSGLHYWPALTITHPSKERVKAAFEGWWQMSQKDWGASEIDWGDMQ